MTRPISQEVLMSHHHHIEIWPQNHGHPRDVEEKYVTPTRCSLDLRKPPEGCWRKLSIVTIVSLLCKKLHTSRAHRAYKSMACYVVKGLWTFWISRVSYLSRHVTGTFWISRVSYLSRHVTAWKAKVFWDDVSHGCQHGHPTSENSSPNLPEMGSVYQPSLVIYQMSKK